MKNKIVNHLKKTWKNKLAGISLISLMGYVSYIECNLALFIFSLLMFGWLFFEKDNVIE